MTQLIWNELLYNCSWFRRLKIKGSQTTLASKVAQIQLTFIGQYIFIRRPPKGSACYARQQHKARDI